ncbi:MAG: cell envelope biogenesis protein TolA, partial [Afipia sp.]
GRLAAEPLLIEASASEKGPALMRSAMDALDKCQPYAMLPADRYDQWRMLDLRFSPKDFKGG